MLAVYLSMLETREDQCQFLKLYQAYEKKVYAVALKVLGDAARAEDAAQQAWTRLLQRWDKVSALDWDGACGYAVTTAKNAALDQLRRDRRGPGGPLLAPGHPQTHRTRPVESPCGKVLKTAQSPDILEPRNRYKGASAYDTDRPLPPRPGEPGGRRAETAESPKYPG